MKISTLIAMTTALFLTACASIDLRVSPTVAKDITKDTTISQPDVLYQETPQSKSIIVGSQVYATVNSCSLIQRYRVRTNSDFSSALNLFKNRAFLMGGKWVTIVHHSETGMPTHVNMGGQTDIMLREGTHLSTSPYLTTIVGDIYDCPCNINSCSGR
jgi:hypothetical protein